MRGILSVAQLAFAVWNSITLANRSVRVIRSIQRGTIVLSGVASNTATITAVDTTKSRLCLLGLLTDQTAADRIHTHLVLTNATTVTATRGLGTGDVTVSFEVVEYMA